MYLIANSLPHPPAPTPESETTLTLARKTLSFPCNCGAPCPGILGRVKEGVSHGRRVGYWLEEGWEGRRLHLCLASLSPHGPAGETQSLGPDFEEGDLGAARNQGKARVPSHLFCEAAARLEGKGRWKSFEDYNHSQAKNNKSDALTCLD